MPPDINSRYRFSYGVKDDYGSLYLTDRAPYGYNPHPDNRIHTVVQGDTLFHLAAIYFAPLERACGFWWVIADFQPEPIVDPTIKLEPGRILHIPSRRVLTDIILNEHGRRYHD